MNYQNIPVELKELNQWVLWKRVFRNQRDTKIPFNPHNNAPASVKDPLTWGSFQEVFDNVGHGYDGIGFVLTQADPYVGIDIDKCRNPQNGTIPEHIIQIIESFSSYSEYSPSGNGIHIWIKGNLHSGGNRNGIYEVYNNNRYLTITGESLKTPPSPIEERQKQLDAFFEQFIEKKTTSGGVNQPIIRTPNSLTEEQIIFKASKGKNGYKFSMLWSGQWDKLGYSSQSEADQAFCNFLAFWTAKNPSLMNSIFIKSGLYRPKWDKIHSSTGLTYGEQTIQKAIAETVKVYNPQNNQSKKLIQNDWFEKKGNIVSFKPKRLGDRILNTNQYIYSDGQIYSYNDGLYLPNGIDEISAKAVSFLGDEFKDTRVKETQSYIDKILKQKNIKLNTDIELINLSNGLLEWRPNPPKLFGYSPNVYSSVRIPIKYEPAATCPKIDKFLTEVLPPDCIQLFEEIIGYLLIPSTCFEKAFLFLGAGANGKSTVIKLIQAFIGRDNFSTESLQNLSENRYRAAELKDKLANIFPDLPDRVLKDTSFFKTLVSGEPISAERKFGQPFTLINRARLIFSANTLPGSSDLSDGFFRRWIVIPFNNSFPPGKADPYLINKLTTDKELSGLLVKAIVGLKRLFDNNKFSETNSTNDATNSYRTDCDSVLSFIKDCCDLSQSRETGKQLLFEKYLSWCSHNNFNAVSQKKFNERLLQHSPAIKEDRNSTIRKWRGIGITK